MLGKLVEEVYYFLGNFCIIHMYSYQWNNYQTFTHSPLFPHYVKSGPCNLDDCTDMCQREFGQEGHGKCEGESPAQICYCLHPCWVFVSDYRMASFLFSYFYFKISTDTNIKAMYNF